MSYEIDWYLPEQILHLVITDYFSADDAVEVNQVVKGALNSHPDGLSLFIDATQMERPRNFDRIRGIFTFMTDRNLNYIYIATEDRLVKLSMMVIFSLSRAQVVMSDSREMTIMKMKRQHKALQ